MLFHLFEKIFYVISIQFLNNFKLKSILSAIIIKRNEYAEHIKGTVGFIFIRPINYRIGGGQ